MVNRYLTTSEYYGSLGLLGLTWEHPQLLPLTHLYILTYLSFQCLDHSFHRGNPSVVRVIWVILISGLVLIVSLALLAPR